MVESKQLAEDVRSVVDFKKKVGVLSKSVATQKKAAAAKIKVAKKE